MLTIKCVAAVVVVCRMEILFFPKQKWNSASWDTILVARQCYQLKNCLETSCGLSCGNRTAAFTDNIINVSKFIKWVHLHWKQMIFLFWHIWIKLTSWCFEWTNVKKWNLDRHDSKGRIKCIRWKEPVVQHVYEMIWDLSAGLGSTDTPQEEGCCFYKRNARHSKPKPMRLCATVKLYTVRNIKQWLHSISHMDGVDYDSLWQILLGLQRLYSL